MSTDIRTVVVLDDAGSLVACGPGSVAAAAPVTALWDEAARDAEGLGDSPLDHVVVPHETGAVAIVSAHGHLIAALTGPLPAVGLLLFDLRTCLGDSFGGEEGAP